MKIGEQYSRKDYEYTIVAVVKHQNKDSNVYMIERRKYGEDEVEYFLQEGEFGKGFKYEGFFLD